MKLNTLQYNPRDVECDTAFSLDALSSNENLHTMYQQIQHEYGYKSFATFSMNAQSFCMLMMELPGTVGVSLGETYTVTEGAKMAQELGKKIVWIGLNKEGFVEQSRLRVRLDYIFISPCVIDTFVLCDLAKVKEKTGAKLFCNQSFTGDFQYADFAFFDVYKLSGFGNQCVLLFNDTLPEPPLHQLDLTALQAAFDAKRGQHFGTAQTKKLFVQALQEHFANDLFFFVDGQHTLPGTLHFGLKDIKARELIKTLALEDILISNGEGCSLGLSRPSKTIAHMGYSDKECSMAFVIDFDKDYSQREIEKVVQTIAKRYRMIKALQ
ncbi:MAG: cysteine desulfurase [Campylobacterota bacterium]